jgi:hypothetical protein
MAVGLQNYFFLLFYYGRLHYIIYITLHARFVLIYVCKISFKVIICFCLFGALDFRVFQSLWNLQTFRIVLSIFSLGPFSELASHLLLKCMSSKLEFEFIKGMRICLAPQRSMLYNLRLTNTKWDMESV